MKVQVFAGLKDYFDPTFKIDTEVQNIDELKQKLISLKPASAPLLQSCRFAVNDDFVNDDHRLSASDLIVVLPPSSGG